MLELSDLSQEALIAIENARAHFDQSRGTFATYAGQWMRGRALRCARRFCAPVRPPQKEEYSQWAAELPVNRRRVRLDRPEHTVDELLSAFGMTAAHGGGDPVAQLALSRALADLEAFKPRWAEVVRRRFLCAEEETLEAIGRSLGGITKEAVREFENKGLEYLRRHLRRRRR